MKSNLEKSVYLGLAALTFASAANGAALNINAKSHNRVKHIKVTYKTTKKDLDQTVVFKSTGKNAIYTKPTGVKGSKVLVNKQQMQAKAKSNKVEDQFMAYQMAVNSKGYHYYKVVSFDKKIRGYVFNKGIVKTNVKTTIDIPAKKMGKLNVDSLYDEAYGAKFSIKASHFNNDGKRKFTIKKAVKVNGNVYYNVADNNDSSVNGWVSADNFTASDEAKAKKDNSNNNPKPLPNPQPAPFVPTNNEMKISEISDIIKNDDAKLAEAKTNNTLNDLKIKLYSSGLTDSDVSGLSAFEKQVDDAIAESGNKDAKKAEISDIVKNGDAKLAEAKTNNTLNDLKTKLYSSGLTDSDVSGLSAFEKQVDDAIVTLDNLKSTFEQFYEHSNNMKSNKLKAYHSLNNIRSFGYKVANNKIDGYKFENNTIKYSNGDIIPDTNDGKLASAYNSLFTKYPLLITTNDISNINN